MQDGSKKISLLPPDGEEKLENGPHGNGDVILMPASDVRYDAGAGGDARYDQPWQDDSLTDKNEVRADCILHVLFFTLKAMFNDVFTLINLSCMSLHAIRVFDKV